MAVADAKVLPIKTAHLVSDEAWEKLRALDSRLSMLVAESKLVQAELVMVATKAIVEAGLSPSSYMVCPGCGAIRRTDTKEPCQHNGRPA